MGFNFVKTSDSSCIFSAVSDGNNVEQFVLCVQKALKNLLLDITIDLAASPKSLGEVLPHLMKLQKILIQHQRAVTVIGIKVVPGSEFVQSLRALGINVLDHATSASAHSVIHQSLDIAGESARQGVGEADLSATGAQPGGVLPPAEEIEVHFTELRNTFSELLREKASLQSEKKSYENRIHALKNQNRTDGSVYDQAQIQVLAELEHDLSKMKETTDALQLQIAAEEKNLVQVSKEAKDAIDLKTEEFRKEKQVLDKQLRDLDRMHEKMKSEFKKRSDTRREKLRHG